MNYRDITKAKEYFDSIVNICDIIDEKELWDKPDDSEVKLRDILKINIAEFIMYLSASDGSLTFEELQVYKAITGYGGETLDSFKTYIQKNNIYSTGFESKPPLIMEILSRAERTAIMYGAELETSILSALVSLYKMIGKIVITVDGGVTYSERRDYQIIISTIEGFAEEHDICGDKWSLWKK